MNEKLNTVFDIINATNTVSANRYLSHALGAEVAIIYTMLCLQSMHTTASTI